MGSDGPPSGVEAALAAFDAAQHASEARKATRGAAAPSQVPALGKSEVTVLKMCPGCWAGPILNEVTFECLSVLWNLVNFAFTVTIV